MPTINDALLARTMERLLAHLRERCDVQNIELMELAGFCRNCLSMWLQQASDESATPLSKEQAREFVYGVPYEQWKLQHQRPN